ncbi:aspartate 1-decarboxylase [Helicobacter trogontum]|uniref:Aspartate 1-decarboxylase n=2 Tax=Helicobacter trogontum TaxID=50960 RepID=A0A4U8S9D6_9HELI|nr:aspartate 1-decarboxylase [Helicobacter trogontum]
MAKDNKKDKDILHNKLKIKQNCYVEMMYAKIHRAVVTDANLNYVGSISIDESIMQSAGIIEGMKVDIVNINNGERFSTYVITAKAGSGTICLNGAAARKVQKGDVVIIIAYASMKMKDAKNFKPRVVLVDSKNCIVEEH